MFLSKGKELFYYKGCKFTYVRVDQTRRSPLTVLLFRNCCKRNCISKDNWQFQKAKLRRARRYTVLHSRNYYDPRLLRVTKSRDQVGVQPSVYAWYRFADVKNSKLFLEPWDQSVGGRLLIYPPSLEFPISFLTFRFKTGILLARIKSKEGFPWEKAEFSLP